MSKNTLTVAIDIGSTTIKVIVLDSKKNILYSKYQRHCTRQAECVLEILLLLEDQFDEIKFKKCRIALTGSGAGGLVDSIGGDIVQEVNAVALAVEERIPEAQSVVELGGQDAKVILFKHKKNGKKKILTFMNDKCASGTGATIDKCMLKLGIEEKLLPGIQYDPGKIHHVAAKCGVFAETDIVNLLKSGVEPIEILNSLADAIVNQNLSVLMKGHILAPKVVLLGGPHCFLPFLVDSWKFRIREEWKSRGYKELLALNIDDSVIVPENALYFAALGTALFAILKQGEANYLGTEKLEIFIEGGRKAKLLSISAQGLFKNTDELATFRGKYKTETFKSYSLQYNEKISGFLGFDGGSTSSKFVVVDREGKVLFKEYTLSRGNPFEDFKFLLVQLESKFKKEGAFLEILGFGVTGYAANIFESVYNADINVVETIAHVKSAQHYFKDIDVICDIGGQDIKVLFLENQELSDFKLSNQCSAGNGMILQGISEQFGHKVEEFAEEAFKAEIAPVFSYGCAVFLDSDRVNFQKQGFSKNEIMAGMAQVLPKNIWQYVVQVPRLEQFGTNFVLQGGTQYNMAALKSQVDYIEERVKGAKVMLHPHPGEAGAIGAALEALEVVKLKGHSRFIGFEDSKNLIYSSTSDESTRCSFCPNSCSRTFIDTKTSKGHNIRYIAGFSCDKGTVENREALKELMRSKKENIQKNTNLVLFESKELFKKRSVKIYKSSFQWTLGAVREKTLCDLKVAMPRVLNMWIMAPFFNSYFQALGLSRDNIIWSSETNEKMSKEGMKYGAIDPCFPAKVVQAHFHQILFNEVVDFIYFPAITHIPTYLDKILGTTTCPVVQGTPLVMRSSFTTQKDMFSAKGVEYINKALDFDDKSYLAKQLFETWKYPLGISKKQNDFAVKVAFESLNEFDSLMQEKGLEVLEKVENEKDIAILFLARPYHLDTGVNHQILSEVQNLGFPVLTMRSIPKKMSYLKRYFEEDELSIFNISDVWPENFSTNSAQKVWAAKFAARNPHVQVIDISSFKCGHDAPTYSIIESIMRFSKTSYLSLHDLDQTAPIESFKIRLKTFAYNLNRRRMVLKK